MSTYRASFKTFQNQGLSIHFKQNTSETIIKCTKPNPSNFPESQTGLYLDISLREGSKNQQNSGSFENNLKEIFDQIVQLQNYPNSMVKIHIFVIEQGNDVQACIINGLWLLLLKLGINMKKSIFCVERVDRKNEAQVRSENQEDSVISTQSTHSHRVIYNLNDIESVIEGEITAHEISNQEKNTQHVREQAITYKKFVLQTMKSNIFN